ncbi:MAG: hypothetical protein R2864_07025 [Syntrophotaleaceae bacterium]
MAELKAENKTVIAEQKTEIQGLRAANAEIEKRVATLLAQTTKESEYQKNNV